jgi:hypothetical protein
MTGFEISYRNINMRNVFERETLHLRWSNDSNKSPLDDVHHRTAFGWPVTSRKPAVDTNSSRCKRLRLPTQTVAEAHWEEIRLERTWLTLRKIFSAAGRKAHSLDIGRRIASGSGRVSSDSHIGYKLHPEFPSNTQGRPV